MKNSFSELTYEELAVKKDDLTRKLREIRFGKVLGNVENPLELRVIRRSIARINTLMHEYALGVRK